MKILFLVHTMSRTRHFESVIRSLAERGHTVTIGASPKKGRIVLGAPLRHRNVRVVQAPHRRTDSWGDFPLVARLARDYVRFLDPRYDGAPRLRWRAQRMLKGVKSGLLWTVSTRSWATRHWERVLAALTFLEALIPTDPAFDDFLRNEQPDLILITPLVNLNGYQADYVKSAHKLGIPIAFLPFSWDNLTSKGLIKILPDWVVVWNDVQKRESVDLHGVPPKRVVVTGAPRFDEFFELKPETTREDFCAENGLDPARPFILYLCSSAFVVSSEAMFARRWITELRASADPRLRTCGVLLRAHPANRAYWEEMSPGWSRRDQDSSDPSGFALMSPKRVEGTDEDLSELPGVALQGPTKWRNVNQDLYDGLYHAAAVVGLNTSALLEAGILGKSVHTVLAPEYAEGQEGTLHFHYLLEANGGLLSVARDFEEHTRHLSKAFDAGGAPSERSLRFTEGFLRPHGLDKPATPIMVRAIERMGTLKKPRQLPTPPWHAPARWLLRRWFPEDFQRDRPTGTMTLEDQASLIDDGPDAAPAEAASDRSKKRPNRAEVPLASQARGREGRRGSVQTTD